MQQLLKLGLVLTILSSSSQQVMAHSPAKSPEKILEIVSLAEIDSLDPVHVNDISNEAVMRVYECLFEYHYLKRHPLQLIPNLAASMPTISKDRLVYTIGIKEGVLFQDNPCFPNGKGRELVAEDFVYSLKRAADPATKAKFFGLLVNKIAGLDRWRSLAPVDYAAPIAGLKVLDRYTLQIVLTQPYPQFLQILAMGLCSVVPHEAVDYYGATFLNHPVGTGPFVVKNFNPTFNKIIFTRNSTFRSKFFPSEASPAYQHMLTYAGKKLPLVDKIINHIITAEQPCWLKFQRKQLDILDIQGSTGLLKEVFHNKQLTLDLQKQEVQLFSDDRALIGYLGFNCHRPPFKDNKKLRQAISLAFDRERYNALFYNNMGILPQSIIPTNLVGHKQGYRNPYSTYKLAKAKQILEESGYPGGKGLPPITLDVVIGTSYRQKGEFFAKCMEQLGIKINIVENIFPELIKKRRSKTTMIHSMGWSADRPDAGSFLELLCNEEMDVLYINDSRYKKLYEKAAILPDSPARTILYEQLNAMAGELAPAVFTMQGGFLVLHHNWVRNYIKSDFHYGMEQYLDIDLAEKNKWIG